MTRKKKGFRCEKCNSEIQIYRRGKGHRLFVCPSCGILASNPLPLLAGALLAKKAVQVGSSLLGGIGTKRERETPQEVYRPPREKDHYYEEKALSMRG